MHLTQRLVFSSYRVNFPDLRAVVNTMGTSKYQNVVTLERNGPQCLLQPDDLWKAVYFVSGVVCECYASYILQDGKCPVV